MNFALRSMLITFFVLSGCAAAMGQEWKSVKGTKLCGISGMVLIGQNGKQTRYLVVHDNKLAGEMRLAIVTDEPGNAPLYENVAWPDSNPPIDAEGISSLPDEDNSFVVASSSGRLFHIKLDPITRTVRVLRVFSFPNIADENNYEGLSFQMVSGSLVGVWGHRGQDNDPAVVYWGIFDPASYSFSSMGSDTIRAPWPKEGIRHIADLKVNAQGILYIVSSSDLGDDGPFQSAVYVAGIFSTRNKNIMFSKNPVMPKIKKFEYHKIEAMEFVPGPNGGLIFGTDDENMGGWIYTTW